MEKSLDKISPEVTIQYVRSGANKRKKEYEMIQATKEKEDTKKLFNHFLDKIVSVMVSTAKVGENPRIYEWRIKRDFPNANVEKIVEILQEKRGFQIRGQEDSCDNFYLEITNIWE